MGVVLPSYVGSHAQQYPDFVAYSQEIEEPRNLDIEMFNVVGYPDGDNTTNTVYNVSCYVNQVQVGVHFSLDEVSPRPRPRPATSISRWRHLCGRGSSEDDRSVRQRG